MQYSIGMSFALLDVLCRCLLCVLYWIRCHTHATCTQVLAIRSGSSHIKIFRWRDSSLSVLFRTQQEIRTVYHIFVSILILFTAQGNVRINMGMMVDTGRTKDAVGPVMTCSMPGICMCSSCVLCICLPPSVCQRILSDWIIECIIASTTVSDVTCVVYVM